MDARLDLLLYKAKEYDVEDLAGIVLNNPKFPKWSASGVKGTHHYGSGKLLEHTLEVVELAEINNNYFKDTTKFINPQKLFLAALFHDIGKIWDYRPVDRWNIEWEVTKHKKEIHHISRSVMVWVEAWNKYPIDNAEETFSDDIIHAILSHHGLKEWRSPVQPNTRLAWLLHLSDYISARMDDVHFKS